MPLAMVLLRRDTDMGYPLIRFLAATLEEPDTIGFKFTY
jgi:hypothetical protein